MGNILAAKTPTDGKYEGYSHQKGMPDTDEMRLGHP